MFLLLYITSLWLIYFVTGSFYLLIPFTYFTTFPLTPQTTTSLFCFCVSVSVLFHLIIYFVFLDSTYKWDHVVFVFLWFISLSKIPSRSNHVVRNGKISLFFNGWLIFHYIYVYIPTSSLFIHLSVDTGCFHILAIVNDAAMNIRVHISFGISVYVFFG